MNFEKAQALLKTARNPANGKPIARNTRLFQRGADIAIQLHNTDIVTLRPDGAVTLNSGGWKTVTTKERMNRVARVYSTKGTWYVNNGIPFADGMTLRPDGTVDGAGDIAAPLQERKLRKRIGVYANAFVDALYAGKIPAPSGGDCWPCCLRNVKTGEEWGGADHILAHLEEKYYVPSLLVNALNTFGASIAATQTAYAFMQGKLEYAYSKNRNDFMAKQIVTCIRRYCARHLGLSA